MARNIYPDSNPGRGSLKVVVRELWSTKYRTPSGVYFISQPGGRGCSLIILQQGEGSEHGPSRRGPRPGDETNTHTSHQPVDLHTEPKRARAVVEVGSSLKPTEI